MAHNDSAVSVNTSEENVMQSGSVAEQLAQAQKEINELKMQLMWMERNYE
ncbi:hypothetical protein [Alteromonas mediterranea]|jgi:TolA-binding protein|nr:hypothetical protein [Alteromonas mediterranea]MEA3382310.1 hypothetical protein [Pseudomonadota bacterium]|tara:strand:- start:199 stop:348 length:150 start_codon:yes stop_codon:yes gene_type:complete